MKTIETDCFGITVTLDGKGGGAITSNMHEKEETDLSAQLYNAAVDGLEAMILAQACAGVDIESPAYLDGIETAVQKIATAF